MGLSKGKFKARMGGGGVGFGVAAVAGAAAGTEIAVAGLLAVADVYAVIRFHAGVPSDVSNEVSVSSAGHIKLSTTDTTGDELVVHYMQPLSN